MENVEATITVATLKMKSATKYIQLALRACSMEKTNWMLHTGPHFLRLHICVGVQLNCLFHLDNILCKWEACQLKSRLQHERRYSMHMHGWKWSLDETNTRLSAVDFLNDRSVSVSGTRCSSVYRLPCNFNSFTRARTWAYPLLTASFTFVLAVEEQGQISPGQMGQFRRCRKAEMLHVHTRFIAAYYIMRKYSRVWVAVWMAYKKLFVFAWPLGWPRPKLDFSKLAENDGNWSKWGELNLHIIENCSASHTLICCDRNTISSHWPVGGTGWYK